MNDLLSRLAAFARRRPRLVLVLYCLALWLPGVLRVPATDRDESRFAQATKQMLETGDFVDIRNGTEARNRKPIGIYWLQAPGAALARDFGIAGENPIWPYRIPSVAGGLIAVLATFAMGRRLAGAQAGLIAGAMLGGCVLLCTEANIAKTDAALLGATTLAMGVLLRAWLGEPLRRRDAAVFWVAMGAGILLKGPITPMVAGLAALGLSIVERRGAWLRALRPAWGIPLALAIVAPWFVAIGVATGGQFFHDAVGGDLAGKLAGGDDAHGAPPGFHFLLLSLTLFPSGAVALCALPSAWAGRREPGTRFLLAWLIPAWIVFEAVPTKLPHYTLPLFPAICLIAAGWLASPARRMPPRWWAAIAAALSVVAALVLGIGGAVLPEVVFGGLGVWAAWGVLPLLAGLALAWNAPRNTGRNAGHGWRAALALAASPLLIWSILGIELPDLPRLFVATEIHRELGRLPASPAALASVGFAEPSLMFLCGTGTQLLNTPADGAAFLAGGDGRVLLVEARGETAFLAAAAARGERLSRFDAVRGFNYSNGRRVSVAFYRLAK